MRKTVSFEYRQYLKAAKISTSSKAD